MGVHWFVNLHRPAWFSLKKFLERHKGRKGSEDKAEAENGQFRLEIRVRVSQRQHGREKKDKGSFQSRTVENLTSGKHSS